MEAQSTNKVPQNLQLAAMLSCGITIAVSTVYLVLSVLALAYRFPCEESNVDPVNLFINEIYRVYIQDVSCGHEIPEDLTSAHTVFILVILILVTSLLSCVTAIVFISFVIKEHELLNVTAYVYIATFVCTLTVDLTLATQFGMDFTTLTNKLEVHTNEVAIAYPTDILRLGAIFLTILSIKGVLVYIVNILLIILIVVYLQQYSDIVNKDEHSIHNLGILDAYDQPKREWEQRRDMYNSTFANGATLNHAYNDDDYLTNRHNPRDNQRQDYSHAYEHSDSWQSNNPSNLGSSRPFTYLEEPARPPKASSPSVEPPWRAPKSSPSTVEAPWRTNWSNSPPVPAPDYSPQPRRLKSALKSSYM